MAQPGWYLDPLAEDKLRLWDGARWCEQTRPVPSSARKRRSGPGLDERESWVRIGAVLGLVAVLLALFGVPGRAAGPSPTAYDAASVDDQTIRPVGIATDCPAPSALPAAACSGPVIAGIVAVPTTTSATTTLPTVAPPRTTWPLPHTETVAPPVVAPPVVPAPQGRPTDFTTTGYRWDACRTITVSSDGPDIRSVVTELASVTGLHLQLVSGPADIVVMWGTVPIRNAMGEAGLSVDGKMIVHAAVVISPWGTSFLPTLLRHELGHAMGVGHAGQPDEVMYPLVKAGSPADYQSGDLAGLRAVGASSGC